MCTYVSTNETTCSPFSVVEFHSSILFRAQCKSRNLQDPRAIWPLCNAENRDRKHSTLTKNLRIEAIRLVDPTTYCKQWYRNQRTYNLQKAAQLERLVIMKQLCLRQGNVQNWRERTSVILGKEVPFSILEMGGTVASPIIRPLQLNFYERNCTVIKFTHCFMLRLPRVFLAF